MAPPAADSPKQPSIFMTNPQGSSKISGGRPAEILPPKFSTKEEERTYLKGRLAAGFRILGKLCLEYSVAGHISIRDPIEPDSFWVNPMGKAFSLITQSDLLRVTHDGRIIEAGPLPLLNRAAFMIHGAIHRAQPNVNCVVHSHSTYGRAFCALGIELSMIGQDACAFYNDHVVYNQFNGNVLDEEEGNQIAAALGNKKAALLQNHGLLTVGASIEEAVSWFVQLESCCQIQFLADAAAAGRGIKPRLVTHEDAIKTYNVQGTPAAGYFSARPLFQVIHKETQGDYLL